jgi:DNA-binding CsgD family transcriptional regulator
MPAAADLILERDAELASVAVASRAAARGAGALILVTGPAGIGKTALLRAAPPAAGMPGAPQNPAAQVLTARGIPLERDFSFGVVRQLLEPARAACRPGDWDELLGGAARQARRVFEGDPADSEENPDATIHGLYWLVANMAATLGDRGPLLIVVDDAHWADAPSLRWLSHLAARIEDLPVILLLAACSGPDQPELIGELSHVPSCVPMPLRPLSGEASTAIVRAWLGGEYLQISDEFCAACHEATGGNPFLLESLLESLIEAGSPPTAADVAAAGPRPVAAATERRLRRLGDGAAELARAVAVLRGPASLRHAAALAGQDLPSAARLADGLRAAGVFKSGKAAGPPRLEFANSITGTAVYEMIPPGERAIAHGRAACLLADDGDSAERIASHLLRAEPAGDPRTVEVLRRAAASARDQGAPGTAAACLRRALAEPPEADLRPGLLLDYGLALASVRDPEAVAVLEDAAERAPSAGERARAALLGAGALGVWGHHDSALRVTRDALMMPGLTDGMRDRLELALFAESWLNAETAASAWDTVRAHRTGGEWRVYEALAETVAGRAPAASREAVMVTGTDDTPAAVAALLVLLWNDDFASALRSCDAVLARARGRGSLNMVADVTHLRAAVLNRMGKLREAADDGRYSLEFKLGTSPPLAVAWAAAAVIDALTSLGRLDEADKAAAAAAERRPPEGWIQTTMFLQSRGVLRVAQRRYDEGLRDLLDAGDGWRGLGAANPAVASWRTAAVEAYAATGREDEAAAVASEQLSLARAAGGRLALGVALRASAPYSPDPSGRLAEAADLLRRAGAPVELARAQADLGARLRRAGRKAQAQRHLRAALETADRCGARDLSRQSRRELLATGARPRRSALTGPDALTGAERRVAALAADGLSNRQIARDLFVTQSTVETHLRHAFHKLGVSSRADLPGGLVP